MLMKDNVDSEQKPAGSDLKRNLSVPLLEHYYVKYGIYFFFCNTPDPQQMPTHCNLPLLLICP